MSNITLSIDDEIIKRVRKITIDKNTTLTAMIREFLNSVAERDEPEKQKRAQSLLRDGIQNDSAILSPQVLSEDLNSGQRYHSILASNPFKTL